MQDARAVVQFLHPKNEHRPTEGQHQCRWETDAHGRKFLEAPGSYLANDNVRRSGAIRFWAEYEPPTRVEVLRNHGDGRARFIHRPVVPPGIRPPNGLNTDPWVFGGFYYSNCQQWTSVGPTQLRNLTKGSLILFGSHRGGEFVLDTCFVVEDYLDYLTAGDPKKAWDLPPWFQEAVLDPIDYGQTECAKESDHLRLYRGAMWSEGKEGPFSFIPCIPGNAKEPSFARPAIRHELVTSAHKQGKRITREADPAAVWTDIRRQVLNAGLSLGIRVDKLLH